MRILRFAAILSLAVVASCMIAGAARAATYVATLLNPMGFSGSYLLGGSTTSQVGWGVSPAGDQHALLWHGTVASAVNLHPAGFDRSVANGASEISQVGMGFGEGFGTPPRALLWHGTAESAVDITPAGYTYAVPYGASETSQVGFGDVPDSVWARALLWHGSAASVVDLNPPGFVNTFAYGVSGDVQVGEGASDGEQRALLWRGSAESVVDLHPAGWGRSAALGASATSQVGYARLVDDSGLDYAMLWHGTAASAVNLNDPSKLWFSKANAASETIQVGQGLGPATGATFEHALLWQGTAESLVDLHPSLYRLDPAFTNSYATSIDAKGDIFGFAAVAHQFRYAVKWSLVPEPNAAIFMLTGGAILIGVRRSG